MLDNIITFDRIELYLLDLPQKIVFKSGIGTRKSKETLIVKWIDQDGRIGYGECSCRPDPYYSAEFLNAAALLIQKFIFPKLKKEQSYEDILSILKQIRGWNFTKSAIESAVFQIVKQLETSFDVSKQIKSSKISDIPVGISLGIYDDPLQMYDVVQEAIEIGYKRVKFKISPYVSIAGFDHVNPILFENNVCVSFDANGSYDLSNVDQLNYFAEIYKGAYFEQPTPPSRFDVLLRAKELFPDMKICFDEEVKCIGDLMKLFSLNVIDELNLKIGRVGGITNSIEIMNYCFDNGIDCWIGGMFETGIGRQQNLELAAYLPKATAHDLSPSSRYFKEDIINPAIKMENGLIHVEEALKSKIEIDRIEKYKTEKWVLKYK